MDQKQNMLNKKITDLEKENQEIKKSIVLSRDKINKNGRPKSLSNYDIENIKLLRNEGNSLRSIAEKYQVSHTTIRNALNDNI